jgi:hypothetical protein
MCTWPLVAAARVNIDSPVDIYTMQSDTQGSRWTTPVLGACRDEAEDVYSSISNCYMSKRPCADEMLTESEKQDSVSH